MNGVLGKGVPAAAVAGPDVVDGPVTSDRNSSTKRGGGGGAESAL